MMENRPGLLASLVLFAWPATAAVGEQTNPAAPISRLERILRTNIVPWWIKHTPDYEYGGFKLNHVENNTYLGPYDKSIVTQSRVVWLFSLLCSRDDYRTPEHEEMAHHGFAFLRDHMWDKEHEGFFTWVSHEGEPRLQGDYAQKQLGPQSYALYALSQYYATFQDAESLGMARSLFSLMTTDNNTHDEQYGGFREVAQQNWTVTASASTTKTLDAHMHLLEGITAYVKATGDPQAVLVLRELVERFTTSVVEANGAVVEWFNQDWSYQLEGGQVNFGHMNELIWLLIEACEVLGMDPRTHLQTFQQMWRFTSTYGYDNSTGAFNFASPATLNEPVGDWKEWWVQCESLITSLKLRRLSGDGDGSYARAFMRLLDFVEGYLVDWEYGEWHRDIAGGRATPWGLKADAWKGPYHDGRAMVFCMDELRRSPLR